MQITRGIIPKGLKWVLYGPEGIGKSTFASKIPGILFIDTEGSTANLDVARLPKPTSWQMLIQEAEYVRDNPGVCSALVIDTADWAERLCMEAVCAAHPVNGQPMKSIEDAGYGKGYVYLYEEFGRLLNILSALSERGVHVGFTAHAMMRKFEQPDELGAYDRWELKMSKKVAPLVKEWADLLLFANYKTLVYAADKDGKKHKAAGGIRVMYTTHHPCWDAKNRHGLDEELPFDLYSLEGLFRPMGGTTLSGPSGQMSQRGALSVASRQLPQRGSQGEAPAAAETAVQEELPIPAQYAPDAAQGAQDAPKAEAAEHPAPAPKAPQNAPEPDVYAAEGVPDALADLMRADGIMPLEVQAAVAQKGYFPMDTPFANYPPDFVQGVLIGAWPQVREMCLSNRQGDPF